MPDTRAINGVFYNSKFFMYGSIVVTIILITIIIYGIYDGRSRIYKILHCKRCRNLYLTDYRDIRKYPEKYSYHAPYGVESALNTFNAEVPYLMSVINTCIERNRNLIERYNNHEDPEVLSAFLKIEIQLTNMIANHGLSLTKRCNFYVNNTSKTFQLDLDRDIMTNFIKNSINLHDQFLLLKEEPFKSQEVVETSLTMYNEFLEFFRHVNELIYIHVDKNYNNSENEKEETKHE